MVMVMRAVALAALCGVGAAV
eukprot:COSAG02_NODE_36721_length_451_cov_0.960227_1_plen_20_part_10